MKRITLIVVVAAILRSAGQIVWEIFFGGGINTSWGNAGAGDSRLLLLHLLLNSLCIAGLIMSGIICHKRQGMATGVKTGMIIGLFTGIHQWVHSKGGVAVDGEVMAELLKNVFLAAESGAVITAMMINRAASWMRINKSTRTVNRKELFVE